MTRALGVVSLLLCTLSATAHDLWIEPSNFRPAVGERLGVALRVGQNLAGDPVPRIPPLIDRFVLDGTPIGGQPNADPAGVAVIVRPGPQWIGYQSKAYPVTLDAAKFESYLKEEGLERVIAARKKNGQSAAPGRERFYRCAKSLLEVAGKGSDVTQPVGFTLELVPRKNPYALRADENLPLTLLFRGKPVGNVLVIAMRKGAAQRAVRARTDAKGHVTLPLDDDGFWLVKAVHMDAAPAGSGVDWESWWASMTFELH